MCVCACVCVKEREKHRARRSERIPILVHSGVYRYPPRHILPGASAVTPAPSLTSKCGTHKTVKARFWPSLSGKNPFNLSSRWEAARRPWRVPLPLPPHPGVEAPLMRTGVRSTCGPISPHSGLDCVKSLRSSYTGLYPQTAGASTVLSHTMHQSNGIGKSTPAQNRQLVVYYH